MPVTSLFWCHANTDLFTCSACDDGLRKKNGHVKYQVSLSKGGNDTKDPDDTQRDVSFVPIWPGNFKSNSIPPFEIRNMAIMSPE